MAAVSATCFSSNCLAAVFARQSVPRNIMLCRSYAGHNKWSKIKHKKTAADLNRSKVFGKLSAEIQTTIRVGGFDPDSNHKLSRVLARARKEGMPKENITKALDSAKQKLEARGDPVVFEGLGSQGYHFIIESVTDKRSRTKPELQTIVEKRGAFLGEPGSSLFKFTRKGIIEIKAPAPTLMDSEALMSLAIEVNAEDVSKDSSSDLVTLTCSTTEMANVRSALCTLGKFDIVGTYFTYFANSFVDLIENDLELASSLMDDLQSHPDVMSVYHNFVLKKENSHH